jgi:putative ABC transport system permease protein
MLKNYFKIAYRNLLKNKVFSFINLLGLGVGMSAFFLIYQYVAFELSYDAFNTKADRIYRLVTDIKTPSETLNTPVTSAPMAINIKTDFPEVENAVSLWYDNVLVRKNDVKFMEEKTVYADPSIFSIFDSPLIYGDPQTALKDPYSIVLSETAAKKYFGNKNPVGETILIGEGGDISKITGVMKDIPRNSQIRPEMLISMATFFIYNKNIENQWGNFGATTYLLLKKGTDYKKLQSKFPAFIEKRNGEERKKEQMFFTLILEPLRDVYLKTTRGGEETGNIKNVYIFSIVGIFILLIACINFVNLTTARSADRAKEVGIKKVVGAGKFQLTRQFLSESISICLIAFVFSLILSILIIPLFNDLAGKVVSQGMFSNPLNPLVLLTISLIIGALAGIYPALVLSSYKPIVVLKGKFTTGIKGLLLRKGLVIVQFTISIALIVGTIIVYAQLKYMREQDLGFSKDQMVVIDTNRDKKQEAFKEEISKLPGVISTSLASSIPGGGNAGAYSEIENSHGDMQIANLDLYFVDYNYIPQFQIKLLAGRSFSKEFGTDTTEAMVLNESAVKLFGYKSPADAIGRKFSQWGRKGKIIGVVKDFHFRSLREPIKPLSIRIESYGYSLVSVKVKTEELSSTLESIEKKWKQIVPHRPFSYFFVDEFFNKQYQSEERFGKLFLNFSILAIFISCLGLLGLALYSTTQRTKEIGVRKVLGASVFNIVNLLSKDFLKLVGFSFLIASPIAWYVMYKWLQDFEYRIDVEWWAFALAGSLAVIIAFGTISFHAVKAAVANPVKSLRTE